MGRPLQLLSPIRLGESRWIDRIETSSLSGDVRVKRQKVTGFNDLPRDIEHCDHPWPIVRGHSSECVLLHFTGWKPRIVQRLDRLNRGPFVFEDGHHRFGQSAYLFRIKFSILHLIKGI